MQRIIAISVIIICPWLYPSIKSGQSHQDIPTTIIIKDEYEFLSGQVKGRKVTNAIFLYSSP